MSGCKRLAVAGLFLLFGCVFAAETPAKVEVMCVYYPHWHSYPKGNEWFGADRWKEGEWEFVKTAKKRFPGHKWPLRPLPGYLNGKDPKDVETEIALASNAGIDVFLYDYYYYDGQITQEEALEEGFLKAKNRHLMKFALMWCYHDRVDSFRCGYGTEKRLLMGRKHVPEELVGLIDVSIERYFNKPEYWRKNGKLFFSIFNANNFVVKVGREKVRQAIVEARARVRAAGLGELELNAQNVPFDQVGLMKEIGFDSVTHYGFNTFSIPYANREFKDGCRLFDFGRVPEPLKKRSEQFAGGPLPYYPVVPVGWDVTPRCRLDEPFPWRSVGNGAPAYPYCGTFTNVTPETVERCLREAKELAEKTSGVVYINGWNEYTEGTYLLPTLREGDAMLRAVARVFGRKPAGTFVYSKMKKWWLKESPNAGYGTVEAPTFENVKYGPHIRQGMDVWLPKVKKSAVVPALVNIHGGGWSSGDRMIDTESMVKKCRDKGLAFITVGYRLLEDGKDDGLIPPVRAPLADAVAAIRFIKARAGEWGIDPARLALTGGSAGACSIIYAALQDDCALGVRAALLNVPQTSLDPKETREWIPHAKYGSGAFGYRTFDDWLADREKCLPWIEKFSGAHLLRKCTASKAPTFFYACAKFLPPDQRGKEADPTHSPTFCEEFEKIARAKGVSCRRGSLDDVLNALAEAEPDAVAFEGLKFDPKTSAVIGLDVAGADWGAKAASRQFGVWNLTLNRSGDLTRTMTVFPGQAAEKTVSDIPGGRLLVWRGFSSGGPGDAVEEVRARIVRDGKKLRWRLGVTVKDGWELNMYDFPRIATRSFRGKGDKDRVVTGEACGGVMKDAANGPYALPGYAHETGKDILANVKLSSAAAQFYCRYDDERLFYSACENELGGDNALVVIRYRDDKRIESVWRHRMRAAGRFEMDFDVVTAVLTAKPGLPCDWYDAADFYKEWAKGTRFCARTLLEKTEFSDFYRSGPLLYRFDRKWLADPEYMAKFLAARKEEGLADMPALGVCFGWEHWGEWVGLDYTPFYPSDDGWKKCVDVMKDAKVRPFLWPSTYHYALRFRTPDYVSNAWRKPGAPLVRTKETDPWEFDHTQRAIAEGIDRLGMKNETGDWRYPTVWMGTGGDQATICYHLDECREIFKRTTIDPLMARGCVAMQLDQFNQCLLRCCFDPTHGHPVGYGRWRVEALRKCLDVANAQIRARDKEGCVCFEGPCQFFLDQVVLQDVRDCRQFKADWANVYTYLFHEYVLPFQAGCHDNRFWWAKIAAEGQVPQFTKARKFYDEEGRAVAEHAADVKFFADWAKLYHGEGRKFLSHGKHIRPPRMVCDKIRYLDSWRGQKIDKMVPSVFHSAFAAADGTRAVSLVNATDEARKCTLLFPDGKSVSYTLGPRQIMLKNY